MNFRNKPRSGGFTLIELMVVISIIGLLSSIILAGLNSAKKKAQDAAIISDLRNFISQAELFRTVTDGHSTVNGILPDTMKAGIQKANGTYNCFSASSVSNPALAGESNLRWACSATNSDKSILWTVSSESGGVSTWDNSNVTPDGTNKTWSQAISHCANGGKRTPSIEELYTARQAVGLYNSSTAPAGFFTIDYWSSTEYTQDIDYAWGVNTPGGDLYYGDKDGTYKVRCIR